jgi:Rrf2 family protein
MNNSRFSVALQVLAQLAVENKDCPTTSESLAEGASTNPVVIRRILGSLRRAGLVTAQPGPRGGVTLRRSPEKISLLEVYRATGEAKIFPFGDRTPSQDCICGRNIQPVLDELNFRAEQALAAILSGLTLAQVAASINEREALTRAGAIITIKAPPEDNR